MGNIRLSYFDFDGGSGETARLALSIGGIAFEDDRIGFEDWPRRKAEMPFGAVPVLEVDGRRVAQSNGINRFVGKFAGLYPDDPWQAAVCDEVMDTVNDIGAKVFATFELPDAEKKTQREALVEGALPLFLIGLRRRLEEQGGRYFADDRLTVADLKTYIWIRHLQSGALDYIPVDLVERIAPELAAHARRIAAEPGVAAYYASRRAPALAEATA